MSKYIDTKILSVLVLVAAMFQVIAAGTIAIDAFTGDTYNNLFTLIQPAGYVFSIWGLIYALSLAYAMYQVVPENNNAYLEHTRGYALVAFIGSSLWLYVAGTTLDVRWLTVIVLGVIAFALYKAVTLQEMPKVSKIAKILSFYALFPYAAWTAIAQFVNLHSIINQYRLIEGRDLNLLLGVVLLVGVSWLTLYTLKKVDYSPWYGLVIVWAAIGVVISNYTNSGGEPIIIGLAGALAFYVVARLLQENVEAIE